MCGGLFGGGGGTRTQYVTQEAPPPVTSVTNSDSPIAERTAMEAERRRRGARANRFRDQAGTILGGTAADNGTRTTLG